MGSRHPGEFLLGKNIITIHADHCVGAEYFEVSDSLPMGKFLYPLRQVGNGLSHVGAIVLAFEVGKMARHLAAG